ncbi:tyrosine-type recombinase/integrase [Halobacterium sp. R2-5]|uniref:tyrosine-type recombinase/integrase n=1 Tax=Halobacterium sp. R2-5 TaxID=2715751 RepID=UPI001424198D|nr:tyrosine-type recombinase/integrase [Halobacterium sp. R2-5]
MGQSTTAASDDPIATFIDEIELYGRSATTISDYETTLGQFRRHLEDRGVTVAEATRQDCLRWIQSLRDSGYADGSIRTKAVHVNRFYGYMVQAGAFDENPMMVVMEEMSERGDSAPTRRRVSVPEMQAFIDDIRNPLHRAIVLTLAKTGIRVGELCNLDLRDVHLDHPASTEYYGVQPRAAVRDRSNTLFVASDIDVGDVVNGGERTEGNKRHRDTRIPVDEELQRALVEWLAVRPDVPGDGEPLFVNISTAYGERLTSGMVRSYVTALARERGWYTTGAGVEENVTPHYFRHFFTTQMRRRTGEGYLVKYLRGDVGDVMDRYTHNWEELVREPYLEHSFRLSE